MSKASGPSVCRTCGKAEWRHLCGGVSAVERHLTDIGGQHVEIKDWRGAVRTATIVTDAVSRPKKAKKSKSLGSSLADPARRANLPLTVGGVEIVPDTFEQVTGAVNHQGQPVAQSGSASGLGPEGRWFKSSRVDQLPISSVSTGPRRGSGQGNQDRIERGRAGDLINPIQPPGFGSASIAQLVRAPA